MKCLWCLTNDHDVKDCPHIGRSPLPAIKHPPETAMDALQHRFLMTRTFAGQLLREMREAGLTPTPATLALNPDPE